MSLLEPLHYGFFVRGLLAATVAGALCGAIGVFVILRRMSYIGHGLSHSLLGGAVASYLLGMNFYVGGMIWGIASALVINALARRRMIGLDAAIGTVTTASFAMGVALISRSHHFAQNFEAALFGNILGVSPTTLFVLLGIAILTGLVILLAYQALLFTTFDPEAAWVHGVRTDRVELLLAVMLAAVILASLQIMGVTLVSAALIIPPLMARLITDRFSRMLGLAITLGAACGLAGMYVSFYLDIASGATIVLTAATLFGLTHLATGLRARRRVHLPSLAVSNPEVAP